MLFFGFFQLFLSSPLLLVRVTGHNHNYRDIQFKYYIDQKFDDFEDIYPETYDSCYVRRLNASQDFTITCYLGTCYLQTYVGKPRLPLILPPSDDLPAACESLEEEKPVPDNMVGLLNSMLQEIRMDHIHVAECDDEFRAIERFQAYKIHGINLGQLGGSNCNRTIPWSKCVYNLKFLSIEYSEIYSLVRNSFCQYRQLQVLKMVHCQLGSIDKDALVNLLNLTALLLPNNRLTHLPEKLFRENRHLQYVDVSANRLQLTDFKFALRLSSLRVLSLCDNGLESGKSDYQLSFPSNLEQLSFSNNEIGINGFKLKNLGKLIQLEIENVGLKAVDERAFQNLKLLTKLRLDGNKIERLPPHVFKSNLKLELLSLNWNQMQHFPPIAHLFNLQELRVRGNRISAIDRADLVNCSALFWMDLSQNQLSFIEDGAFDNVPELRGLNLSHNRLSEKSVNFSRTNCKFYLHLDYNNFTEFSFRPFPLDVEKLTFRFNKIEAIKPFDVFDGQQQQRKLTDLDLSNNRLISIEHLNLPTSVYSVNLSSNLISQLWSSSEKLSQRRYMDLRNNNITVFCASLFEEHGSDGFNYYYLSSNPLRCTCENMWIKHVHGNSFVTILDVADMSCKPLSVTHPADNGVVPLNTLDDHQFLCESKHADSSRCKCYHNYYFQCEVQSCPYNCTCLSDANFERLYFRCNSKGFKHIPSQFLYSRNVLEQLEVTLDFRGNSISMLGPFNFDHLNLLIVTLILSNSTIEAIEPHALDELGHLRSLSLAYNRLETLPNSLFHALSQLTSLDLSHNRLKYLADDAFSYLNRISSLNIHDNNLRKLELQQINGLKFLKAIALHNNPWTCECAFMGSFTAFLIHTSVAIQHKLDLKCVENGGEELLNVVNYNMDNCLTQIHLTIIIASLTAGLILITLAGLVFVWRYELQVLIFARYGLRMLHRAEEEVENKQYDAFVAYNSKDELFLVNELLPKLEAIEKPYRLCIHHRDFPVGAVIQDSILDAIEISSRTIILLSESFVSSGWCRFEFKSAHMKMLKDKCPRILVILVGDVQTQGLEPEMKLYLKTNTYLQWEEKLFWEKLYYSMPDIRVTTPLTEIMPMNEVI